VEMPEGVSYKGIFGDSADKRSPMGAGLMLGRSVNNQLSFHAYGAAAGGFGGRAGVPAQNGPAAPLPALGQLRAEAEVRAQQTTESLSESAVAIGQKDAVKKLDAMKPEERRALLRQAKLS